MEENQNKPVTFPNYPQGIPVIEHSQAKPLMKMIKTLAKPKVTKPLKPHRAKISRRKKTQFY